MAFEVQLVGMGVVVAGVIVVALADAWLFQSVLTYLDAIEANVEKLVEAVQAGGTRLNVTGIDRRRDRGQDRARALKMFGWLITVLGFGLQIAAAWATMRRA
jgi:hypothetical protein